MTKLARVSEELKNPRSSRLLRLYLTKPPKDLKKLSSKTLPYWKNWKKTERLQHSPERAELLVILLKKEPEVLEKLIKLVEKWTELLIILQKKTLQHSPGRAELLIILLKKLEK